MIKLITILCLFALASCSNIPVREKPAKLFPFGTYHHNISIQLKDKDLSFPGLNLWTPEKFVVVGLGPMDVTIIKYEEDKVNYKKDLYINKEFIPLEESRALQMISLLKEMYELDRSICEGKQCKKSFWGVPILFDLNELDQVSKIHAERQGIKVNVDITSYEKVL
jgi:hypothetical protein